MSLDWSDGEDDDGCPDPTAAVVGLDANALDRKDKRHAVVDRFMALAATGGVNLLVGPGVEAEMSRLGSEAAELLARTSRPSVRPLTAAQHLSRIRVRAILCGNAQPGKHDADAVHVSEAAEAGCSYFITYDGRILRKRHDLEAVAVPTMKIVTLEEFLVLFDNVERAPSTDRR